MNPLEGEETVFAEALRLPSEERAVYLAQATQGKPELLQRIESLLRSYRAGHFLEEAAAPRLRQTLEVTVPVTEKPGETIGRYKLREQIGEGGCGIVYVAEQAEPVRRRVALKIIKLGMDTKSVIARFEAERQALALMDHPNIAKVFDAGATETGRPYFVMELVRGMKITDYCDEKKLSTRERLDLFIEVCQAIQHAHQKGIIHRDIKPSNILVTLNDGIPVPKVIDFGIAKATSGQQLTDKTIYTAFEQFIGTPAYMSPEQAVLTSLDIDTRSDIYALGVLLYELLTGKTPFDGKELLAIGLDEMRRTIREQEPQRPSTRLSALPGQELSTTAQRRGLEAPKLVSELRGDLDWIVMKTLEKDRGRRYETANGLAMDIQRHLKKEPVVARPPSTAYRFGKLVYRNKLAFTAAGAIVAALILGLGISTWMFLKEKKARQRAVAAENTARIESSKSRQVAQFLEEMLSGVGPSVALGRDTQMLREILDKTVERVGRDLKDQPDVEAELRTTIGQVYFALGAYQKASEMHRVALAIRQKMFGDEHLAVADSLNNLGVVLDYQEKHSEAEPLLRKGLALRRELLHGDDPDVATSIHNVAHVLADQQKFSEAAPVHLEALEMRKRLFGNEHLDVARSLTQLAHVLRKQGKFVEAESLHRDALVMRRKLVGNEHPEVEHSLFHLATLLVDMGRFTEAETMYREAVAMKRNQTPDHPGLGSLLTRLGIAVRDQGRMDEAESTLREAVERQRKVLPNDHSEVRYALNNLADVLWRQGKFAERQTILRQVAEWGDPNVQNELAWQMATSDEPKLRDGPTAVSLAQKAVDATNRKNPSFLDTLAAAYAEAGQFSRAVALEQEAISLSQDEGQKTELVFRLELFKANSPFRDSAFYAGELGLSAMKLLQQEKFAEAEARSRECLAIRERNIPDHWLTSNARSMLGGSLLGQKKYAEAETVLLAASEGLKQRQTQIPPVGWLRIYETFRRLVQLYENSDRPALAIEWKQKLDKFESVLPLPERADAHARRGQFSEAAADLTKTKEVNPDDHALWHGLAALLVASGQLDTYREHCRNSVGRFGNSTNPLIAERIAKDCLILPASGADLPAVAKMAGTAVAVTNHWAMPWFQFAKGLAEYRQGRFAEAVEWINKTLTKEGKWQLLDVEAYMVLAMGHYQLKQTTEARAAFAKGAEIERTKLPKLENGDIGDNWLDWIIAHALQREARSLIEGSAQTTAEAK